MSDLNLRDCLIYLDDIVIFSKSFEEHAKKLQEHGLTLKPSKCELFRSQVVYFVHVVSKEGIHTDPSKTEVVKNWPSPKCTMDVHKFLGFTSYYCGFIKGYASIARSLNDLLIGHPIGVTSKKRLPNHGTLFTGEETQQKAFETIIRCLTGMSVLAYADYSLPFELHTDASSNGLGVVLYLEQNVRKRVVAYASRCLKLAENMYGPKVSCSGKTHDYLYGS